MVWWFWMPSIWSILKIMYLKFYLSNAMNQSPDTKFMARKALTFASGGYTRILLHHKATQCSYAARFAVCFIGLPRRFHKFNDTICLELDSPDSFDELKQFIELITESKHLGLRLYNDFKSMIWSFYSKIVLYNPKYVADLLSLFWSSCQTYLIEVYLDDLGWSTCPSAIGTSFTLLRISYYWNEFSHLWNRPCSLIK